MDDEAIRIDGIVWVIHHYLNSTRVEPICPKHHLRLSGALDFSKSLYCEDCKVHFPLPRYYQNENNYVINRIDAKNFKKIKVINFDDEATPLAEKKIKNKDYFVTTNINQSKTGTRVVIYAGKNGSKNKTQIFVEPDIRRLSFDQHDLHPSDIFTKVEATFLDGTTEILEKKK